MLIILRNFLTATLKSDGRWMSSLLEKTIMNFQFYNVFLLIINKLFTACSLRLRQSTIHHRTSKNYLHIYACTFTLTRKKLKMFPFSWPLPHNSGVFFIQF